MVLKKLNFLFMKNAGDEKMIKFLLGYIRLPENAKDY